MLNVKIKKRQANPSLLTLDACLAFKQVSERALPAATSVFAGMPPL